MTPEELRAQIAELVAALPDDVDVLGEVIRLLEEFETFITTGEIPEE